MHHDHLTTLHHGLRVLEFVAARELVSPKEIAASLGFSLGTTYHVVNTLIDDGYLARAEHGMLVLGDAVSGLIEHFDRRLASFPELDGVLDDVARRSGEVAALGRLLGRQCVIIAVHSAAGAYHADHLHPGMRGPAYTMALGKALLAGLQPAVSLAYLRSWPFVALTDRTITSVEAMLDELETVRSRGFAVDVEEGEPGLCCVAAPIRVPRDRPMAAIAVAVSPERLRSDPVQLTRIVVGGARVASAILEEPPERPVPRLEFSRI